jgi:hypothetical protein
MTRRRSILAAAAAGLGTAASRAVAADPSKGEILSLFNALGFATPLIKSRAQLDEYMAQYTSSNNPLSWLSPAARSRFLNALEFSDRGLMNFPYRDIEAELTLSQAYRIMALFGAQTFLTFVPDIRVVSDEDRAVDAWRQLYAPQKRRRPSS